MSSAAIRGGRVAIEIGGEASKFFKTLDRVKTSIKNIGANMGALGANLTGVGVAFGAPFAAALAKSAEFQQTMAAVAAVTDATGVEFEQLRKKALDLGSSTSFSAKEVADGMQALGQGGFTVEETLKGIEGTLLLARAGMLDLATATSITVATLRSFNMPTTQAAKVADVLAKAANSSNATVEGLGNGLAITSGLAATAGASLESVTAALGVLADRGTDASVAGTAVRRIFLSLATEQDKLKNIGVEVKDPKTGKLRPLLEIIRDLKTALGGLDSTDQIAKLSEIFDAFGANAASQLIKGVDSLDALTTSLKNSAGSAKRAAGIMDDTLSMSFKRFVSSVFAAGIALGDVLSPAVRDWLAYLTRVTSGLAEVFRKNQALAVALGKMAAMTIGVGGALVALGVAFRVVAFSVGGLGLAMKTILSPMTLMIGASRVMAGALTVMAGAIYAASAAAATFTVTIARAAIAAAGAAATCAGAWASILGPIAIVAVAIAGIAIALAGSGDTLKKMGAMFGATFAGMKAKLGEVAVDAGKAFSDIYGIATVTLGGISDAITAGDLSIAFDVLWIGLQAAWLRGQQTVMGYVDAFVQSVQGAWDDLTLYLVQAISGGTGTIEGIWNSLTDGIYDIWTKGIDGIVSYYNAAVAFLAKQITWLKSFFDGSINYEQMAAEMEKANEKAKGEREQRTKDRASEREKAAKDLQEKLGDVRIKAGSAREATNMIRDAARAVTIEELRTINERANELKGEGNITQELYDRLQEAIDSQSVEIDKSRAMQEQEDERAAAALDQLSQVGDKLMLEGQKIDAAGTFNTDAILGMGYSTNLQEQIAKNTGKTAEEVGKLGGQVG